MNTRTNLWLAAVLAAAALASAAGRAQAHDRFAIGVSIGAPVRVAPVVERRWVPGHYETRIETVLLEAEHYERVWAPPLYETRYTWNGRPYTVCVREGCYRNVLAPARYGSRETAVWVPGHWQEVLLPGPGPHYGYPRRGHPGIHVGAGGYGRGGVGWGFSLNF